MPDNNYKKLGEDKGGDYLVQLFCNIDDTEAYLHFDQAEVGCSISLSALKDLLANAGVAYGVDENAMRDLVERMSAGVFDATTEDYILVARSKPARHSEDGRVEYLVNPSSDEGHFKADENQDANAHIDYKNTNLIQNVMEEQALATIIQPSTPVDGVDVFGNPIKAREGKPLKLKLGANISFNENRLYAVKAGRFVLEGDQLSVTDVYLVRGDVDYTIGNINFVGRVEIQRDVLDDFSVFGKEGVTVGGVVGAANIESDGTIVLNGGANGKGKGFVRAQEKVESKYFNEVTVVCRGNIEVQKHVMNSFVKSKGAINVINGSVIGGELSALMGIDVAVVGSDLGTMTTLIAGVDYERQDRMKAYENQLAEIQKEVDRVDHVIGPLLKDKNALMALPIERKRKLKGLLQHVKTFKEEQIRIREEMAKLEEATVATSVREICVRKMLYSGTRIIIGKCKRVIKMEVKGPVRLKEDLENDTITISNLTL